VGCDVQQDADHRRRAGRYQRHLYRYDALGRRIEKVVDADGPAPQVTRYFYDGW
jgi:YD repeat-containing protein